MDPVHLNETELEYELNIRGVYMSGTRRRKAEVLVERLREEENNPTGVAGNSPFQIDVDISECSRKIAEVADIVHRLKLNQTELGMLLSRVIHIGNRIRCIKTNDQTRLTEIQGLQESSDALTSTVADKLEAIKNRLLPRRPTNRTDDSRSFSQQISNVAELNREVLHSSNPFLGNALQRSINAPLVNVTAPVNSNPVVENTTSNIETSVIQNVPFSAQPNQRLGDISDNNGGELIPNLNASSVNVPTRTAPPPPSGSTFSRNNVLFGVDRVCPRLCDMFDALDLQDDTSDTDSSDSGAQQHPSRTISRPVPPLRSQINQQGLPANRPFEIYRDPTPQPSRNRENIRVSFGNQEAFSINPRVRPRTVQIISNQPRPGTRQQSNAFHVSRCPLFGTVVPANRAIEYDEFRDEANRHDRRDRRASGRSVNFQPVSHNVPNTDTYVIRNDGAAQPIAGHPFRYPSQNFIKPYIKRTHPTEWKIQFSGGSSNDKNDLPIHEFLFQVEGYRIAENYSEEELFRLVVHLLSGEARSWFLDQYNAIRTWPAFVHALKRRFLSEDYQYRLKSDIQNRKQQKSETVSAYINDMQIRFKTLPEQPDEKEKLHIIKSNLLPHYIRAIAPFGVQNVESLERRCRLYEESYLNIRAEDRKTFKKGPKTIAAVQEEDDHFQFSDDTEGLDSQINLCASKKSSATQTSLSNKPNTIVKCFNCQKPGHNWRDCPSERTTFCYKCGRQNTKTNQEHGCPKNTVAAMEELDPGEMSD